MKLKNKVVTEKSFVGLEFLRKKKWFGMVGRPHTAMRIFPSSLNKIKSYCREEKPEMGNNRMGKLSPGLRC